MRADQGPYTTPEYTRQEIAWQGPVQRTDAVPGQISTINQSPEAARTVNPLLDSILYAGFRRALTDPEWTDSIRVPRVHESGQDVAHRLSWGQIFFQKPTDVIRERTNHAARRAPCPVP